MEAVVCRRNQQMNSLSCDWQPCQWCTTSGNTHKSYLTVRWSRPVCVCALNCVRCTVACSQVRWPGFETLAWRKHYCDIRGSSLSRAKPPRAHGEGENMKLVRTSNSYWSIDPATQLRRKLDGHLPASAHVIHNHSPVLCINQWCHPFIQSFLISFFFFSSATSNSAN